MENLEKIYIIGIEGAGTSALALMYKELGYDVSGSDDGDHFYGDVLAEKGIKVFDGYSADNLPRNVSKVIYSTAIKENNPELVEATKRNFKKVTYPEALAELFNKKIGVAICGTHGKTTTTALLAFVLNKLNLQPSAIVGSKVLNWSGNSLVGKGDYFVIEADEYQNKLRYYNPWSAILTGVDYDHPDFYKDFADYKKVFADFVKKIPGHGFLFYCNDDCDVVEISKLATCQKFGYGFSENSDYEIRNEKILTTEKEILQTFEVFNKNKLLEKFKIKILGRHNVLNATAVIAFCHNLNLDLKKVAEALNEFSGTARRFQHIGKSKGAILIDDYAHHPEEIKATLRTARSIYGDKEIIVVFHPHSFTRTEALLDDFAQSFGDCSKVIVLDIYGSARENSGKVNSRDLVEKINQYYFGKAEYVPTIEGAVKFLQKRIGDNQVVISIGAGDVWRVTKRLAENR